MAILCALFRFGVCCFRGAYQTITIDEATTYNQFVSGPWKKLFGRYDANNHILSSIMIKITVFLSGLSPFTLRFPSIVAGFFVVVGAFWLLKRIESPVIRWCAFALVCLNPMLFDFSIAARGYSLCLAFFVWALYFAMDGRPWIAGALLGLSFAANLAIAFPVLALLVVFTIFEPKSLLKLAIPAVFLAALITYPSLRTAQAGDFYLGFPEFSASLKTFLLSSLYARNDRMGIIGDPGHVERSSALLLTLFLLLTAGASAMTRTRRQLIPFLILVTTLVGLVAAHWLFQVKYPVDRTCLYFVILGAISWAVAADSIPNRYVQAIWILPMIVVAVQFSTQLQTRYFQYWQDMAQDKEIAALIEKASAGKTEGSLAISATWIHQPTLEFYRRYLQITALKPVLRLEPAPLDGFDFYVLGGADIERAKQTNLKTVFTSPYVILAEP